MSEKSISGVAGVRGLMSIIVIVGHFTLAFIPQIGMGEEIIRFCQIKNFISNTPFYFFFNGAFAVYTFWTLSAVLIFCGNYKKITSIRQVALKMLRKYVKWTLPILLIAIYICISICTGIMYNEEAAKITGSVWLDSFYQFPVDIGEAIREMLFDIYISGNASYNMVLWSMRSEFWGSLLVLFICLIDHYVCMSTRLCLLIMASLIATESLLLNKYVWLPFAFGIILGYKLCCGGFTLLRISQVGGVLFVLYAGGYPSGHEPAKGIYETISLCISREMLYCLGAIVLLMITFCNNSIFADLLDRTLGFLGKISMSVYIIQLPILCTVICWIYCKFMIFEPFMIYIGIVISYVISFFFNRFIDMLWRRLSNKIAILA